jgi:mRNA interferase MazF
MERMRGSLVTVSAPGPYGKPRPALVIQSDDFEYHPSIVVLPLTGDIRDDVSTFRITVEPTEKNGLAKTSQIMVDKPLTIPADKIGDVFGVLDAATIKEVDRVIAVFLGIV